MSRATKCPDIDMTVHRRYRLKALRIHTNPVVTAGFLLGFFLLVGFLFVLPTTSSGDEHEGGDSEKQLCDDYWNPQDCEGDTPTPTSQPTESTPTRTPRPTTIDCNGPFHPSCFITTPIPTPEPTPDPTPDDTDDGDDEDDGETDPDPPPRPPAPTGLSGEAVCDTEECDVSLTWNRRSG